MKQSARLMFAAIALIPLAACNGYMASNGPSSGQVQGDWSVKQSGITVEPITAERNARAEVADKQADFADAFAPTPPQEHVLGGGDTVRVLIWETPPSMLFSGVEMTRGEGQMIKSLELPSQHVKSDGTISVPFAGEVKAAGKTTAQLEAEIVKRLRGKANQPQVMVQLDANQTRDVTVVGEFNKSTIMPITSKGEHLLDAVAAAGGVKGAIDKTTLQITRGDTVRSMPMQRVVEDPQQNVVLQPGDIVTALVQPLKLSMLGATGKNEELSFESQGITLVQALARAGGMNDALADKGGVFVFRFEDPKVLGKERTEQTPAKGIPVVYTLSMDDSQSFFLAQNFTMHDGDVLYVSDAPSVDLQKFLNIMASAVFTFITPINTF